MGWFENLRNLKETSNMSMREIAAQAEIPEPTLEKIFSGATKNPGINTIQKLVHALGYTLNDIDPTEKTSPSTDEPAPGDILDAIQQQYGEDTKKAVSLYIQLDTLDKGMILGEMTQMRRADKYQETPCFKGETATAV